MLEAVVNNFYIKRELSQDLFPTLLFKICLKYGVIEAKGKIIIPWFIESSTIECSSRLNLHNSPGSGKIGDYWYPFL